MIGAMTTGREQGKGSGRAVSRKAHIALSVWHEEKSRNMVLEIPDRITIENLLEQAQRELG
jgi:hypothetical protein